MTATSVYAMELRRLGQQKIDWANALPAFGSFSECPKCATPFDDRNPRRKWVAESVSGMDGKIHHTEWLRLECRACRFAWNEKPADAGRGEAAP